MNKLLGTLVSVLFFIPSMAQKQKQIVAKKDSINKFTDSIRSLPPLEIKAIRLSEQAPFAKTNISKAQIALNNVGQDLPFLLENTPSVVVHADAGIGVGYTGIRIRGTDATRINFTLNGIPYNDAESMGTFFVNIPDFSSSANSIQIQRGVGTSTNGAGAFGASVNLMTNEYNPSAYLSLQNTAGSFNSFKNNIVFGSGLINNKFTIDGRVSSIRSDGFIDRASSDLKSFFLSGTYWGDNSSLRLNIFSGKERTYQAWYGVPQELLATNRTFNPAGTEKADAPYENQTDNYTQTHYQLFYNKQVNSNWKWNTAFFLTTGKGYYEEYKAGVDFSDYNIDIKGKINVPADLVRRRWLDNNFYGQIAAVSYLDSLNDLTVGGGWSVYDGLHFGTLPYLSQTFAPAHFRYYDNDALKKEMNSYVKWERKLTKQFKSFIDLQYRYVSHQMNGFTKNTDLEIGRTFNFFNPKMGLTYQTKNIFYYTSVAVANKEPNRDDFEASATEQPRREQLIDWEAGFEFKKPKYAINANIYYMDYKDQLVLTGKINDVGAYTRVNVPKSYRTGLELQVKYAFNKYFNSSYNITLSQNKIEEFTEYIDDYDQFTQVAIPHKNTNIALSPSLTTNRTFNWKPNDKLSFFWTSKYTSKQFLDNTQNKDRILDAFFINDINAHWTILNKTKFTMLLQLYANNILDVQYAPNGYTFSYIYDRTLTTSNNFYPMAGRNYWISLKIDLK
ncbi:MAG: TonB-dependent receptor [Chitinophagia bacterium]|nr:TonB-dependent receptor [Chitinophagia bacterium]